MAKLQCIISIRFEVLSCFYNKKNIKIKNQNITEKMNKKLIKKEQQFKQKLDSIRTIPQLKIILKSAKQTNQKLSNDVSELKNRVQQLKKNTGRDSKQPSFNKLTLQQMQKKDELDQLSFQLQEKYSRMKRLKQQLATKKDFQDPQKQHKRMKIMNEMVSIDKKITKHAKQIQQLKQAHEKLNQTLGNNDELQAVHEEQISQLQQQNISLKIQIAQMKKKNHHIQYQSIKIQSCLVDARNKDRSIRKSLIQLSNPIMNDQKNQDAKKKRLLINQIRNLKTQVLMEEEEKELEYVQLKKQSNYLIFENKQYIKYLKQLQNQKTKHLQQNNYWKKKWGPIRKILQKQNKKNGQKFQIFSQTSSFQDEKPLRRDFAGILGQNRFWDREILCQNKQTYINQVMVYETQKCIVGIQAFYDNNTNTQCRIPLAYLAKCKNTMTPYKEGQYIKKFKIKYDKKENRISKLEVTNNLNKRFQFGDKKSWQQISKNECVYELDIDENEYPVCIFGSIGQNKANFYLQSLGCQINNLPNQQQPTSTVVPSAPLQKVTKNKIKQ